MVCTNLSWSFFQGDLDNSDFVDTDIPSPYLVQIPTQHAYPEDAREEIRELVLETAVCAEVDQELPTRRCEHCHEETYDAGIVCHLCKKETDACIVTGLFLSSLGLIIRGSAQIA